MTGVLLSETTNVGRGTFDEERSCFSVETTVASNLAPKVNSHLYLLLSLSSVYS